MRHVERAIGIVLAVLLGLVGTSVATAGFDLLALPAVVITALVLAVFAIAALVRYVVRSLLVPGARVGARIWRTTRPALQADPAVMRITGAWRRVTGPFRGRVGRWIGRRFLPRRRGIGLTLTLAVTGAAALALWRVAVWVSDPLSAAAGFDVRFVDMATRLGESSSHRLMDGLSAAGSSKPMLVATLALVAGAVAAGARRGAALIALTALLSSGQVGLIKDLVGRPRPAYGMAVDASAAFPSGHAAAALALALGLSYAFWRMRRRRWQLVVAIAVPLGLLVGYSRAALTVHWPTDVLGGWLVAVIAAGLVVAADLSLPRRWELLLEGRRADGDPPARRPAFLWGALAASALFAAVVALLATPLPRPQEPPLVLQRLDGTDVRAVIGRIDLHSTTLFGRPMEPAGLLVAGDQASLEQAARDAGWEVAADLTTRRLFETYAAGLRGGSDASAPVTPTFLDQRMQDFAIERPGSPDHPSARQRHHARFWKLPFSLANGCEVWAATASLDDRVEWNLRTVFPNHHIAPAIDVERELLAAELVATGGFTLQGMGTVSPPTLGTNAAGDYFFTDGRAAVLQQVAPCRGSA